MSDERAPFNLFGMPVYFTDDEKIRKIADKIRSLNFSSPEDVFVFYEIECGECQFKFWANMEQIRAGIECPGCRALRIMSN